MKTCTKCSTIKPLEEFYDMRADCKECTKARSRKWNSDNPDTKKNTALVGRFNMTLAEYRAMLNDQGGVCAICKSPPGRKALAVDHDWSCCPGKTSCGDCVRGLLCENCNTALGKFKDDIGILYDAALYLSNHS